MRLMGWTINFCTFCWPPPRKDMAAEVVGLDNVDINVDNVVAAEGLVWVWGYVM